MIFQMKSGYKTNFCIDNLGNEYKGHGLSIGTYPCHPSDGAIDNQVSAYFPSLYTKGGRGVNIAEILIT